MTRHISIKVQYTAREMAPVCIVAKLVQSNILNSLIIQRTSSIVLVCSDTYSFIVVFTFAKMHIGYIDTSHLKLYVVYSLRWQ